MKTFLTTAVVATTLCFLGWYGWHHAADLPDLAWRSPSMWLHLAAALALYNLAFLLSAVNWRWLLAGYGVKSAPMVAESVYLVTQIGKYLPGNVGHFAGRVAFGRERGISAAACSASTLCEQLLAVSAVVLFMGIDYLLIPTNLVPLQGHLPSAPWLATLLLVAGFSPLFLGTVSAQIGHWIPGRLGRALLEVRNLGGLYLLRFVVVCWGGFFILGLFVTEVAEAVAGPQLLATSLAALVFAAAWVTGLLTPGAPAGMGVRETIMVVGLAPMIGEGPALAIALTMRVVSITGDGTVFLIGLVADRLLRRRGPRDIR